MNQRKPKIGLASNQNVRDNYLTKENLIRIEKSYQTICLYKSLIPFNL